MSDANHRPDEHDLGLSHDLPTLLNRRRALGLLSGAGQSCKHANPHKTWCGNGKDDNHNGQRDHANGGALANTGA
jgi:hypothetical protein